MKQMAIRTSKSIAEKALGSIKCICVPVKKESPTLFFARMNERKITAARLAMEVS